MSAGAPGLPPGEGWRELVPGEAAPEDMVFVTPENGRRYVLEDHPSSPEPLTLDDLALAPRWVAWQVEQRKGRPTKVPYDPARARKAAADDPNTWATRDQAELAAARLPKPCGMGGVGIMLGDVGEGRILAGLDLDACCNGSGLEPWAKEVIERLDSYSETSPSGSGVKTFCLVDSADLAKLKPMLSPLGAKLFKRPGGGDHPPAIEAFLGGSRYFAVTNQHLAGTPIELRLVPYDTLLWLVQVAGPAFSGNGASADHTNGSAAPKSDRTGQDRSGSGKAFGVACKLHRAGKSYSDFVAALRAHPDPDVQRWLREKGEPDGERELRRAWQRADTPDTDPETPPQFSENALAYRFTAEHGEDLVYVHELGKWLRWHRGLWVEDHAVQVFDRARAICARAGNEAIAELTDGTKIATTINKASTVGAIERLARHHAKHVRPVDAFDADPLLLNTPLDSLDLRDAITPGRPHRKQDYATRSTTSAAAQTADCPTWTAFLMRIMGNDPEMVAYLQRVCGYMLTGSVAEHALFFGWGSGANGKSTFANVVTGILGVGPSGYAAVAPISTFTASQSEQHPTDLAMLRGVRCVIAQETEEGRSWAVAKLKMMTGGDPITARFMRQDFFTYWPQFKVLILGNHKPAMRGVDEATRRRMHFIPFTVTIPPAERDPHLGQKLEAEYPGILCWMLEGCFVWQRQGLQPPPKVLAATAAYLAGEDSLAAWLSECCWVGMNYYDTLIDLFASWKSWAEANGERPGPRKELAKALDTRAEFVRRENRDGRAGWDGLTVKPLGPPGSG